MSSYCIGIDLGGTFTKFVAVSDDTRPTRTIQLPTPVEQGSKGVAAQMVAGARQLMIEQKLAASDVRAVGVGAPGPLKIDEGVVVAMPNIPGMENVPLARMVGDGLGLPCALENDANAAALGEFLCGAGRGVREMVLLTLGTGVGSGIIQDGRILHGAHGAGGELGHMVIVPGGEECGCGQRGCLERYCSATYLARRAARRIEQEKHGGPLAEALRRKGRIDARDVVEAASGGDKLASEVWNQSLESLALGCVNICRIFDPDRIVLAGGMVRAGDALLDPLREHFARLHWKLTPSLTEIVLAELGNDAGAIGAAGVAWKRIVGGESR